MRHYLVPAKDVKRTWRVEPRTMVGSAWGVTFLLHEHVVGPTRSRLSTVNGMEEVNGNDQCGILSRCGLDGRDCLHNFTLLLLSVCQVQSSVGSRNVHTVTKCEFSFVDAIPR